MKKAAYIFSLILVSIFVIVFVIWTRISENRWIVYLAPLMLIAIIFVALFIIEMISKKNKREVDSSMKNTFSLPSSIKLLLWDRLFNVEISYAKEFEKNNVTDVQKIHFESLQNMIESKRHEIERILEKYYIEEYELEDKQVLISELKPQTLIVTRKDQCALAGYGPENGGDEGFVLIIGSELDIMPQDEYYRLYREDIT
ncbi:hypothetical protein CLHUN_40880 [Ruminiclostridium hungatei]|uniref:Uncharacterized protein n=1 Tax=Ruminiclostridium hungatei TaxID=48256 RepID=A0A1V4SDM9_RUMHU|nr:hypothetical protein [Ruminiclostridium hungatei]OPX42029.1 hypothetical protein CLHUN_40880 [Ruminiclostridium hungatei]